MNKLNRILLSVIFLFMLFAVRAQNQTEQDLKNATNKEIKKDPNDTIPKTWKKGGLFNLNFNQAALSNWSAGGENSSVSLTSYLNIYAFYKKGKYSWDNTLDLAYGIVSTTSLGRRKTDDRIDAVSKYGYEIGKKLYLSGLFNFRSQFANGYTYPNSNTKVFTSKFLSPAYLLLSLGIDYKPNENISLFVSPATARWVIVQNDSLSAAGAYGVDPGKKSKFQFGAFASINYKHKISTTSVYQTKLNLFSNYLHNPQDINIYWTNILSVKVSKVFTMSLSVDIIYDNDVKKIKSDGTEGGPAPQIKELFGLGLAFKF